VLALDSGGSKTAALLVAEDGTVLGRANGRGTASLDRDPAAVRSSLMPVVDQALACIGGERGAVCSVHLCLGGLNSDIVAQVLSELLPASHIRVRRESSGDVVRACAPLWGFDIAVMAGTGSIAHGVDRAGRHRVAGGWGPLIHDRGSGYTVGRHALRAVAESLDLQGPATVLLSELASVPAFTSGLLAGASSDAPPSSMTYEQRVAIKERIKEALPQLDRRTIAALFPLVVSCAARGDAVAAGILRQAGVELARLVCALARQLELSAPAVITLGGVFSAGPCIVEPFMAEVTREFPAATCQDTDFSLLTGAAVVALQEAGVPVTPAVLACLRSGVSPVAGNNRTAVE
jgi:N-acetylglucosamine kinase-like BadF-type ATPase